VSNPPKLTSLLAPDEPAPFEVVCATGASPFVLTADHAGNLLPRALGDLGVPPSELARHIAWDIGVAALARALSVRLDACLILQTYSRLVIDVNRPPGSADSITPHSERTPIPGNCGLSAADVDARARAVFWPYHERIARALDQRAAAGRPTALIALHTFTPTYLDVARRFHAGVLYQDDTRLAHALLAHLRNEPALVVGDNEPYGMSDETDYTVPIHAGRRGLPYVELEIRQDLLADAAGVAAWADRLAALLVRAFADAFPT